MNALSPQFQAETALSISLAAVARLLESPPHAESEPVALGDNVIAFPVPTAESETPATVEPGAELPIVKTTRELAATVDRAAFANAIATAAKVIERRNTVPILAHVAVTAAGGVLSIEGTDLDLAVRTSLPCSGDDFAITVPAERLAKIAAHRKAGEMTLQTAEAVNAKGAEVISRTFSDFLALKAGRSVVTLPTLPATDFPTLDCPEFAAAFTLPVADLAKAFAAVEFAISTEETRYYLNGVYLHTFTRMGKPTVRMVATDGHRLAHFDLPDVDGAEAMPGVIVPRKAVAAFLALMGKPAKVKKGETAAPAMVTVDVSDSKIRLTSGGVRIMSKLIDGTYPDYARVIPAGNDKVLTVASAELAEALGLVSLISSERGRAVRFALAENRLTLSVSNPDSGSAVETIDCAYTGDPIEIGFNSGYVADILEKITPAGKRPAHMLQHEITVRLADPGSPTIFESDTGPLCVLMPMRV